MARMLTVMFPTIIRHKTRSVTKSLFRKKASTTGMGLFALLLPVFLITFNVSYITNSEWLYAYGWWKNDVDNLNSGADQIKRYFRNDVEFLDVRVSLRGNEVSLYTDREVLHMVDVKALMQSVFAFTWGTGSALLVLTATGVYFFKRESVSMALRSLRWSAIGTGTFLILFGIVALVDFGWLFTQFHFLSFANDLWILNPQEDYLLIMFPQQFFFDATLFIGLLTVMDFCLIYVTAHYIKGHLEKSRN
jgi:integral membrane protein (TIGR01906 family)